jgi:(-)-germacrene D synthase
MSGSGLRLDVSGSDNLPNYMKFLYRIILDLYEEIEQEMKKNGRVYALNYHVKEVRFFFFNLFINTSL